MQTFKDHYQKHDVVYNDAVSYGVVIDRPQNPKIVKGFSSDHADEEEGNTVGHHSFFVCFQEIGNPDPDPDPEPPKDLALTVSKKWLDSLTADDDGFIRIYR